MAKQQAEAAGRILQGIAARERLEKERLETYLRSIRDASCKESLSNLRNGRSLEKEARFEAEAIDRKVN
jgi:hypothetical protein